MGRAAEAVRTDTVRVPADHRSMPSALLPILKLAEATGLPLAEVMLRLAWSTVISGPALVVTLFTGDSSDDAPQRLTAATAT